MEYTGAWTVPVVEKLDHGGQCGAGVPRPDVVPVGTAVVVAGEQRVVAVAVEVVEAQHRPAEVGGQRRLAGAGRAGQQDGPGSGHWDGHEGQSSHTG
ncbi:hypothetical protein ACVDFE_33890 [Lentzea chajnantorensis]